MGKESARGLYLGFMKSEDRVGRLLIIPHEVHLCERLMRQLTRQRQNNFKARFSFAKDGGIHRTLSGALQLQGKETLTLRSTAAIFAVQAV